LHDGWSQEEKNKRRTERCLLFVVVGAMVVRCVVGTLVSFLAFPFCTARAQRAQRVQRRGVSSGVSGSIRRRTLVVLLFGNSTFFYFKKTFYFVS
jgi:hypothetical protein